MQQTLDFQPQTAQPPPEPLRPAKGDQFELPGIRRFEYVKWSNRTRLHTVRRLPYERGHTRDITDAQLRRLTPVIRDIREE